MNEVDEALYDVLEAGTALITALGGGTAIYHYHAPQTTAFPYVLFFQSAGGDENSSPRRARDVLYTVKVVDDDADNAGDIHDEVDTLLHEQTLTLTNYGCYWLYREQDICYVELGASAESLIWHIGAQYRIRIAE
jgi:hypothetical protein